MTTQTATDAKRYQVNLACGDSYESNVRPGIGNYRRCIHCDCRVKVAEVIDLQAKPARFLSELTTDEKTALHDMMRHAYDSARKLELWAYRQQHIDRPLTDMITELLEIRLAVMW